MKKTSQRRTGRLPGVPLPVADTPSYSTSLAVVIMVLVLASPLVVGWGVMKQVKAPSLTPDKKEDKRAAAEKMQSERGNLPVRTPELKTLAGERVDQ